MQPVEVNAGAWYLRALRHDERLSDVPALTLLGVDDPADYVRRAHEGWTDETGYLWAVCIPTTGELVAVIGVTVRGPAGGDLRGLARDGYAEALEQACAPVSRLAADLLRLDPTPLTVGLP
ncbi:MULTISPECIES: hypothetical protein [Gordonia]|uniref:hypothetical protein n=1 Tax=Gordonia TaxID=2053 RepID=UPI003266958E